MAGDGPGRKPKLTPKVQETICRYISAGSFRETACAAAGIDSRTLRKWLKKAVDDDARGEETDHTRFRDAIDLAGAAAEARDVAHITKAGAEDWRALAWILERRGAKRWSFKAAELAAGGAEDRTGAVNVIVCPTPEAAEAAAVAGAKAGGSEPDDSED